MSISYLNISNKNTGDKLSATEFNSTKNKINEVVDGVNASATGAKIGSNGSALTKDANGRIIIPLATTSQSGAMSASDKTKLNAIDLSNVDVVIEVIRTNNSNTVTTTTTVSDVMSALDDGKTVVYKVSYASGDPTISYFSVVSYTTTGSAVTSINVYDNVVERLVHSTSGISLSNVNTISNISVNGVQGTVSNGVASVSIPEIDMDDVVHGKLVNDAFYEVVDYSGIPIGSPTFSQSAVTPNVDKLYVDVLTKKIYLYNPKPQLIGYSPFKELSESITVKTINSKSIVGSGNVELQSSDIPYNGNKANYLENVTDVEQALDTLDDAVSSKQSRLVSGTNIKTICNQTIVGSGNLSLSGSNLLYNGNGEDANLQGMTIDEALEYLSYQIELLKSNN